MTERCTCAICNRRSAMGQAPLPGISVAREQHLTADELSPKPAAPKTAITPALTRRDISAAIQRNNRGLADAIGECLADLERELRAEMEAKIQDLKMDMAWVESRQRD